eukprot:5298330-Pyramimonas_sp.AAC.1
MTPSPLPLTPLPPLLALLTAPSSASSPRTDRSAGYPPLGRGRTGAKRAPRISTPATTARMAAVRRVGSCTRGPSDGPAAPVTPFGAVAGFPGGAKNASSAATTAGEPPPSPHRETSPHPPATLKHVSSSVGCKP